MLKTLDELLIKNNGIKTNSEKCTEDVIQLNKEIDNEKNTSSQLFGNLSIDDSRKGQELVQQQVQKEIS